MPILFTRFPLESRYGGAEVQTLSLMEGLKKKGHYVRFLGSCPTLLKKAEEIGIPTTKLEIGDPPVTKFGAVSFLWRRRGMKRELLPTIKGEMEIVETPDQAPLQFPNVVLMLSLSEKLLMTEWCVKHGINVIWVEHDRVGRWLTKNPWLPKLHKLSSLVKTVVVSDLSREIYIKLGWRPEDVIAIPNGIVFNAKKSARSAGSVTRDTGIKPNFHLGCLSRLTYDKGIDVLIEAVNSIPHASLKIVGAGKEKEKLRALAKKSEGRIKFIDYVDDLNEFYSSIDALVLPSREHDPFGICIAEAMAYGVPTICTDACGIASYLEKSESIIVKAGGVEALRKAILEIQKPDICKKLAEMGPKVVEEKFSAESMIEKYEELIDGTNK